MGIIIECNRKAILHCSNSLFDVLYQSIHNIIDEKNISSKKNLIYMLEEMDQDLHGLGAIDIDIADYLKIQSDVQCFANLVKEAIEREKEINPFSLEAEERLWDFHKELIKYGQELRS